MTLRSTAKDPIAWLAIVAGIAGGGAAGTALDQPASIEPTIAVSVQRYERDRDEDARRMERLEDKLDRVLEQLVRRDQ